MDYLRREYQKGVQASYPNVERRGCPEINILQDLAVRSAWHDDIEDDRQWKHVTHCAPYYQEYLDPREAAGWARGPGCIASRDETPRCTDAILLPKGRCGTNRSKEFRTFHCSEIWLVKSFAAGHTLKFVLGFIIDFVVGLDLGGAKIYLGRTAPLCCRPDSQ